MLFEYDCSFQNNDRQMECDRQQLELFLDIWYMYHQK